MREAILIRLNENIIIEDNEDLSTTKWLILTRRCLVTMLSFDWSLPIQKKATTWQNSPWGQSSFQVSQDVGQFVSRYDTRQQAQECCFFSFSSIYISSGQNRARWPDGSQLLLLRGNLFGQLSCRCSENNPAPKTILFLRGQLSRKSCSPLLPGHLSEASDLDLPG